MSAFRSATVRFLAGNEEARQTSPLYLAAASLADLRSVRAIVAQNSQADALAYIDGAIDHARFNFGVLADREQAMIDAAENFVGELTMPESLGGASDAQVCAVVTNPRELAEAVAKFKHCGGGTCTNAEPGAPTNPAEALALLREVFGLGEPEAEGEEAAEKPEPRLPKTELTSPEGVKFEFYTLPGESRRAASMVIYANDELGEHVAHGIALGITNAAREGRSCEELVQTLAIHKAGQQIAQARAKVKAAA